jgi:hypothetical protein
VRRRIDELLNPLKPVATRSRLATRSSAALDRVDVVFKTARATAGRARVVPGVDLDVVSQREQGLQ